MLPQLSAASAACLALLAGGLAPASAQVLPECDPNCRTGAQIASLTGGLTSQNTLNTINVYLSALDGQLQNQWFNPVNVGDLLRIMAQIAALQTQLREKAAQLAAIESALAAAGAREQAELIRQKAELERQIATLQSQIGGAQQALAGGPGNQQKTQLPFAPERGLPPPGSPWRDPAIARALGYAAAPDATGSGYGYGGTGTRWSAWAEATTTRFERSGAAATDGDARAVTAGLNYRAAERLIVGMMFGYESQRFDTTFNGGFLRGSGPSLGPFASVLVTPNIIFNVTAGAASLGYSASDGTASGGYDARRYSASASVVGNWRFGAWRFAPRASLSYARELRDGYIDSAGLAVPSSTIVASRFSAGPEVGYTFVARDQSFAMEPFAFAALDCDHSNQPGVIGAGGIVISDSACGGRAGGGFKTIHANGATGMVGASYNSIGRADQSSWSLQGRFDLRF